MWTFRAHGARLVPVSSGPNGLDIDELEQTLSDLRSAGDRPKLIYLTPDYQNPTGVQMPTMLRRRLVELAANAGCLIVEDAAYAEVGIDGIDTPSLLSLAPEQTVQVGTFSKVIGPGLRIGWLTGSAPAVQHAAANRTDMGTSVTLSRMLARFLANDELDSAYQSGAGGVPAQACGIQSCRAGEPWPDGALDKPRWRLFLLA